MNTKKYKVLLINPPFYRLYRDSHPFTQHPLSLAYLSNALLKKTKVDVKIFNSEFINQKKTLTNQELTSSGFQNYLNNLNNLDTPIWQELKSIIKKQKPNVIGITCNSQNYKSACNVAKIAKTINSKIITIIGGPHPSMVKEKSLEKPNLDICVYGEGEETIVELINSLINKKNIKSVKGICYKKGHQIIKNPPRVFIKNLDSLDFPHQNIHKTLINYSQYPKTAFKNIFATRGCPNQCVFCGSREIWSRCSRLRSPENVVREILSLQKFGLHQIRFDDDTFGAMNHQYITSLCQLMIKKCPNIRWECEINVSMIDNFTVSLMRKAGCNTVQLGIESGNNNILREIKKNITIEQAINACQIIKKNHLILEVFFIVGFPQETEKSLEDTLTAIKKINAIFTVYSIFTPYPGTDIFKFCQDKGLIDNNFDTSLYNHQSPLNHFCLNLSSKKLREKISIIEKVIDKKNSSIFKKAERYLLGRI